MESQSSQVSQSVKQIRRKEKMEETIPYATDIFHVTHSDSKMTDQEIDELEKRIQAGELNIMLPFDRMTPEQMDRTLNLLKETKAKKQSEAAEVGMHSSNTEISQPSKEKKSLKRKERVKSKKRKLLKHGKKIVKRRRLLKKKFAEAFEEDTSNEEEEILKNIYEGEESEQECGDEKEHQFVEHEVEEIPSKDIIEDVDQEIKEIESQEIMQDLVADPKPLQQIPEHGTLVEGTPIVEAVTIARTGEGSESQFVELTSETREEEVEDEDVDVEIEDDVVERDDVSEERQELVYDEGDRPEKSQVLELRLDQEKRKCNWAGQFSDFKFDTLSEDLKTRFEMCRLDNKEQEAYAKKVIKSKITRIIDKIGQFDNFAMDAQFRKPHYSSVASLMSLRETNLSLLASLPPPSTDSVISVVAVSEMIRNYNPQSNKTFFHHVFRKEEEPTVLEVDFEWMADLLGIPKGEIALEEKKLCWSKSYNKKYCINELQDVKGLLSQAGKLRGLDPACFKSPFKEWLLFYTSRLSIVDHRNQIPNKYGRALIDVLECSTEYDWHSFVVACLKTAIINAKNRSLNRKSQKKLTIYGGFYLEFVRRACVVLFDKIDSETKRCIYHCLDDLPTLGFPSNVDFCLSIMEIDSWSPEKRQSELMKDSHRMDIMKKKICQQEYINASRPYGDEEIDLEELNALKSERLHRGDNEEEARVRRERRDMDEETKKLIENIWAPIKEKTIKRDLMVMDEEDAAETSEDIHRGLSDAFNLIYDACGVIHKSKKKFNSIINALEYACEEKKRVEGEMESVMKKLEVSNEEKVEYQETIKRLKGDLDAALAKASTAEKMSSASATITEGQTAPQLPSSSSGPESTTVNRASSDLLRQEIKEKLKFKSQVTTLNKEKTSLRNQLDELKAEKVDMLECLKTGMSMAKFLEQYGADVLAKNPDLHNVFVQFTEEAGKYSD